MINTSATLIPIPDMATATSAAAAEPKKILVRAITEFQRARDGDPDELIKKRFLCRGGGLLITAPTGVGKSTFSMMAAISFALGREFIGMAPARPLRSLIVQAENDDGDMAEMRDGAFCGLDLTDDEKQTVGEMVKVVHINSLAGDALIAAIRPLLDEQKPDLLWLDPAFAYLEGESDKAKDVGDFLRRGLNPLITDAGCAVVIVHHTAKPPQATNGAKRDQAYSGQGSTEWANWSRAILAIETMGKGRYRLHAAKRGGRLDWRDAEGSRTFTKVIEHCADTEGNFWWIEGSDEDGAGTTDAAMPTVADLVELVPMSKVILKPELQLKAQAKGIPDKTFRALLEVAINDDQLFEWSLPRRKKKPAVGIARSAQPEGGTEAP